MNPGAVYLQALGYLSAGLALATEHDGLKPQRDAHRVVGLGALNDQGLAATYSEPGACVTVVAPSRGSSLTCSGRPGITTTDLLGYDGRNPGGACEPWDLDYTSTFGGTSAATPIVSGVVALLLQANPALSWRDVKETASNTRRSR